jgi:hypothetical protein
MFDIEGTDIRTRTDARFEIADLLPPTSCHMQQAVSV